MDVCKKSCEICDSGKIVVLEAHYLMNRVLPVWTESDPFYMLQFANEFACKSLSTLTLSGSNIKITTASLDL